MWQKNSPMILGVENSESYIASDVPAILKYTRNVYYVKSGDGSYQKGGDRSTIWMVMRSERIKNN